MTRQIDFAWLDDPVLEMLLDDALVAGVSDYVWQIVAEIERRTGNEDLVI